MGQLELICGSMFSGKSEELIRRTRRVVIAKKKIAVFKPSIDKRYGASTVNSHNGSSMEARVVDIDDTEAIRTTALREQVDVVAIDEAQFFDDKLVGVVNALVAGGLRVIVAGLDLDFAGRPFGPMPALLALADEVTKLKAICVKCGEPAFHTQRLINGQPASARDPLIAIGGKESYEARCRKCYELRED